MDKLLLLDKDGTLVRPTKGEFVNLPWEQSPLPGVLEALNRFHDWTICIISNQGGIAAGHKSLESAFMEMLFLMELFPEIKSAFFCPDFEGETCWRIWGNSEDKRIEYDQNYSVLCPIEIDKYRKPSPGMLQLAIDIYNPEQVLFVGDRAEDMMAAQNAKIDFLWADKWREP